MRPPLRSSTNRRSLEERELAMFPPYATNLRARTCALWIEVTTSLSGVAGLIFPPNRGLVVSAQPLHLSPHRGDGPRAASHSKCFLSSCPEQPWRTGPMTTTSRFNRRDFLKGAAPAAIALTQSGIPARSAEDAPPDYAPTFFNVAEWKFINAAVDRLIPVDAHGPGGVEAGGPIFID